MLVPISYNLRSLFVRKSSTLLTIVGIAATVAVVAGVLALQQGFATLYKDNGADDVFVFLRPGATYEGYSMFTREGAQTFIKSDATIELGADGQPLAAMECFSAIRRFRAGGGETNIPIRGVEQRTFDIRGDAFSIVEGRMFTRGSDEVVVGKKLRDRMPNFNVGDVVQVNVTPFKIVGIFECPGPAETELWGDFDRMLQSLERFGPNRLIAKLKPGTDIDALGARLEESKEFAAKVQSERDYLTGQTEMLSMILVFLSRFLGLIMGVAAIFTATNTMLSAIAARTHEIGILLSTGFRPGPIFLSFLFEALLLGLVGGLLGCLLVLPINGIETGTTNFQTFTEVAFSFRVTPTVLLSAVAFSVVLGLFGGAIPAWRAARMTPTEALRRR